MAGQSFLVSDAVSKILWENSLDREIRASDPLLDPDSGLAGEGENSLIVQRDQLSQEGGGTLRIQFRYQLNGRGRAGNEQQKGHEESLDVSTMDIVVDTLRNAYNISSPIQEQYINFSAADEGRDALADWAARRLSFSCHAHAAGLPITDNAYRLHNAIAAVNSEYILRPNGKAAGDLTSNDRFDIDLLNEAAERVTLLRPKIRPASTPWGPKFCVFISPEQRKSLKQSDSNWYAAMVAALQGGDKGSGVFTRALGMFDDFLIFVSDYVPPGLNSGETAIASGTRRAWIGGAGALTMVFGRGWKVAPGYSPNRWSWVRESEDFDHQHAICVRTIAGIKRTRFTRPTEASARENGVLVIETAADIPSGLSAATMYKEWTDAGLTIG